MHIGTNVSRLYVLIYYLSSCILLFFACDQEEVVTQTQFRFQNGNRPLMDRGVSEIRTVDKGVQGKAQKLTDKFKKKPLTIQQYYETRKSS